jgi:hypothetical protein
MMSLLFMIAGLYLWIVFGFTAATDAIQNLEQQNNVLNKLALKLQGVVLSNQHLLLELRLLAGGSSAVNAMDHIPDNTTHTITRVGMIEQNHTNTNTNTNASITNPGHHSSTVTMRSSNLTIMRIGPPFGQLSK